MNIRSRLPLATLVAAALLAPAALPCRAQDALPFSSGTRLRVTIVRPSVQTRIAPFQAFTDSTLVFSADAVPRVVPLADISRLEWSEGRHLSVLGGVLGLIVGVAAGAAVACDANRDSYGVFCGGQNDTKVVVGSGLGGAAGATAGAFLLRRERWNSFDLNRLRPGRP
jgi:hypothetical protein